MAKQLTKKEIIGLLEQVKEKMYHDIGFFRGMDNAEMLVKYSQVKFCLIDDILTFINTGDKDYINLHI